jgi:hypothetical protein
MQKAIVTLLESAREKNFDQRVIQATAGFAPRGDKEAGISAIPLSNCRLGGELASCESIHFR